MKKIANYSIMMLSLILLLGFNSCSSDDDNNPETEVPAYMEDKVPLQIGSQTFMLSLFDNATGRAFRELLPLTISMEDVNANEKFYQLPQSLPGAAANPGTIRTGDLMAYGGNGLVLFYKTFPTSYSYARIGTVDNPAGLESALGSGTVTITFGEVTQPQPQNATLLYNTNGADSGSAPAAITGEQGTTITLHDGSGFGRTGYTFAGWNTNADGTGTDYAAGSSFTLTGDTILYAKWNQVSSSNTLKITVGSSTFTATLASNETATAFKALLPMTINMSELNNNEKYYNLPQSLPADASNPGTIQNGDLMLYGSTTFVLFYKTFSTSYSYTRIGSIDNPSGLENALGAASATVTFEISTP